MVCKGRLYGQEKLGGAGGRMTFRCHVARAAVADDDAFSRSDESSISMLDTTNLSTVRNLMTQNSIKRHKFDLGELIHHLENPEPQ